MTNIPFKFQVIRNELYKDLPELSLLNQFKEIVNDNEFKIDTEDMNCFYSTNKNMTIDFNNTKHTGVMLKIKITEEEKVIDDQCSHNFNELPHLDAELSKYDIEIMRPPYSLNSLENVTYRKCEFFISKQELDHTGFSDITLFKLKQNQIFFYLRMKTDDNYIIDDSLLIYRTKNHHFILADNICKYIIGRSIPTIKLDASRLLRNGITNITKDRLSKHKSGDKLIREYKRHDLYTPDLPNYFKIIVNDDLFQYIKLDNFNEISIFRLRVYCEMIFNITTPTGNDIIYENKYVSIKVLNEIVSMDNDHNCRISHQSSHKHIYEKCAFFNKLGEQIFKYTNDSQIFLYLCIVPTDRHAGYSAISASYIDIDKSRLVYEIKKGDRICKYNIGNTETHSAQSITPTPTIFTRYYNILDHFNIKSFELYIDPNYNIPLIPLLYRLHTIYNHNDNIFINTIETEPVCFIHFLHKTRLFNDNEYEICDFRDIENNILFKFDKKDTLDSPVTRRYQIVFYLYTDKQSPPNIDISQSLLVRELLDEKDEIDNRNPKNHTIIGRVKWVPVYGGKNTRNKKDIFQTKRKKTISKMKTRAKYSIYKKQQRFLKSRFSSRSNRYSV